MHRFNKEFVDFKWQHVFEVVDQVVDLIVPTREVANASCFDRDDTVIIRVVAFVRLEFNEFFAEVLLLFTSSVGTTLPLAHPAYAFRPSDHPEIQRRAKQSGSSCYKCFCVHVVEY